MKKFVPIAASLLLLLPVVTRAQGSDNEMTSLVTLGVSTTSLDTKDFDLWAVGSGNKSVRYGAMFNFGISVPVAEKFMFSIDIDGRKHNTMADLGAMYRLWHGSRLNGYAGFTFGVLYNKYKHLSFDGSNPDDDGYFLKNESFTTGFTFRNYLRTFQVGKNGDALQLGLLLSANMRVDGNRWKYGYEDPTYYDGENTYGGQFHGHTVDGIPPLGRYFFNAGIVIGYSFAR